MCSGEVFSPALLRKNLKMPWKSQGKLREFTFSKCGHPASICLAETTAEEKNERGKFGKEGK